MDALNLRKESRVTSLKDVCHVMCVEYVLFLYLLLTQIDGLRDHNLCLEYNLNITYNGYKIVFRIDKKNAHFV